ncbi:SH3 domain-containing protein [uncultured Porphyromonas sp.]|uniref:SH3 domain-containing protein n=1 Tax=uncultured Porphyromonas sp. TaxID=159274 RepID=UPI00341DF7F3
MLGCTTLRDVQLLKEPSSSSPVSIRIGADVVVHPMAIKGEWVKVKHTNSSNKSFTGWVKASSLCGNPITLCSR